MGNRKLIGKWFLVSDYSSNTREITMVMVCPVNEAFCVAMKKAARALRNGATHGVTVEAKKVGYTLQLIDARAEDHRFLNVVQKVDVESLEEIESTVCKLEDRAEFDGIPVFLLQHLPEAEYRNKWVLVDPGTLKPRDTSRGIVESSFNSV